MGLVPQHLSLLGGKGEHVRYFALQPIFSPRLEIVAYEALYRAGPHDYFSGNGDAASRIMIDNQFLFGYEGIARQRPVFLNCTRDTLQSQLLTMLPNWIGIEILESVEVDVELLELCHQLKQLGHTISLDDFEEGIYSPETVDRLYALADFVKIDVRTSTGEIGPRLMDSATRKRIKVVAEKIESETEFRRAVDLGFDLFQGHYLRPPVTYARRICSGDSARIFMLFDHLDLDLFSDQELAEAVKCAPSLERRLMRQIIWLTGNRNSATSVYEAIQLIGRSELRKLIALALSCIGHHALFQEEVPGADLEWRRGSAIPCDDTHDE